MDNLIKTKLNTYTQNKNALQALQRKQTYGLIENGYINKKRGEDEGIRYLLLTPVKYDVT